MSLTKKIVLAVSATISVFLVAEILLLNKLLTKSVNDQETALVSSNRVRAMKAFDTTLARLDAVNLDWSYWTETYDYMLGRNDTFPLENLQLDTLSNIKVNQMTFISSEGKVLWHRLFKDDNLLATENFEVVEAVNLIRAIRDTTDNERPSKGILRVGDNLLLTVTRSVYRSDQTGPAAGALLVGQLLDDAWVRMASEEINVNFMVHNVQDPNPNPKLREVYRSLKENDHVETRTRDFIHEYTVIPNVIGSTELLLEVQTPRTISKLGKRTQLITGLSVFLAGITIMFAVSFVMRRVVVRPLQNLMGYIERIRLTGEMLPTALTDSDGEIGQLARRFSLLMASKKTAEQDLQRLALAVEQATSAIAITDLNGRVVYANRSFLHSMGISTDDLPAWDLRQILSDRGQPPEVINKILCDVGGGKPWYGQALSESPEGARREEEMTVSPLKLPNGKCAHVVITLQDVTEKRALEQRLAQAQKLQSIGQLAAGIAHEINTPAQFVGDNTRFLEDSFRGIGEILSTFSERVISNSEPMTMSDLAEILESVDAAYLMEEIPRAITQSLEGIARIRNIVLAMKSFSHPSREAALTDINGSIESTVTVSANEWRYVADVDMRLDPNLPAVYCHRGEMNQVFLNIIVNAAHAIAEVSDPNAPKKGRIVVSTNVQNGFVEVHITDTGAGMPDDVRDRIFDPFFTTKPVGKGTGQGLAIAYDIVVNRHSGQLLVDSKPTQGTCFTIRLPLTAPADVDQSDLGVTPTANIETDFADT
jgi:PAS domain S-box-containing protein